MDFANSYCQNKLPDGCLWIDLPSFKDERGMLSCLESDGVLPFAWQRIFWITDVPEGQTRGGHAHRTCAEVIFPLHGAFDIAIDDANSCVSFHLSSPNRGILIPAGVWCKLEHFEVDTVCLVLASQAYSPEGYIDDYQEYLRYKQCK